MTTAQTSQDRAQALAGLSIIVAQTSVVFGAVIAKRLFPLVGPEAVAALRTTIAALLLLALVRPWRKRIAPRDLKWIVAYGLTLGVMHLSFYWAMQRIPIGLAAAIEISGPLAVVLLSSRTHRDFGWFLLALLGIGILVPWPGRAHPLDPLGILLALGAAACWALYIVFGRRAARVGSASAVSIGMVVSCLVTVPVALGTGTATSIAVPHVLLLAAGVAVLSSGLPYSIEMRAMAVLPSRVVGVLSSMSPAIASLIGFLALGEALRPLQWLAVGILVLASMGSSLGSRPPVAGVTEDGAL